MVWFFGWFFFFFFLFKENNPSFCVILFFFFFLKLTYRILSALTAGHRLPVPRSASP